MSRSEFRRRLTERARQANVDIPEDLAEALGTYFQLLATWNQKINLAGMQLDDPSAEAIDRLLIEPILAARQVQNIQRMIDIGSGGGSPAIPMALSLNPSELVMVESKSRKAVFLTEAARALGLHGARVVNGRYEELADDFTSRFDLLTVRAVRLSPRILGLLQRFVRPGGFLMAFTRADFDSQSFSTDGSLRIRSTHDLSALLQSRALIFEKHRSPTDVPRGTF